MQYSIKPENDKMYVVDKNNIKCSKGYNYIEINKDDSNYLSAFNIIKNNNKLQKQATILYNNGNYYEQLINWISDVEYIKFLNIDKTKLFLVLQKVPIKKSNKFKNLLNKINFLKINKKNTSIIKQAIYKLDNTYLGYDKVSPLFDDIKIGKSLLKYGDYYIGKNNNLEQIFKIDSQIPISKKFSKIYTYGLLDSTSDYYIVQNKDNDFKTVFHKEDKHHKLVPYSIFIYANGAISGKSNIINYINKKRDKKSIKIKINK